LPALIDVAAAVEQVNDRGVSAHLLSRPAERLRLGTPANNAAQCVHDQSVISLRFAETRSVALQVDEP
jgi:hypothetical protein